MIEAMLEKFVGIDVSKATLDVHIDTAKKSMHMDYDDACPTRIVECLREAAPTLVVMEATGGSASASGVTELTRHGSPRRARAVRNWMRCAMTTSAKEPRGSKATSAEWFFWALPRTLGLACLSKRLTTICYT
jgi:transposase